MNLKTQAYEDKAPPAKRSVWYQHLYKEEKGGMGQWLMTSEQSIPK